MNWSTVKLIFSRELRDQMRDRRTLFTVAILPLILYPMMGMALLQVAQFMREHPTKIWIVGSENLPQSPEFIVDEGVSPDWCGGVAKSELMILNASDPAEQIQKLIEEFKSTAEHQGQGGAIVDQLIQNEMQQRGVDLAVFIPKPVDKQVDKSGSPRAPPQVYIFQNSASDKSNIAATRFAGALALWQKALVNDILLQNNLSSKMVQPFQVSRADVAQKTDKRAAAWSKILPFIIMIWSLTGAFYPAVDLCAGEKERGTFETLLSSPARRSEIAIGKLLTVMTFSIVTSLLNLLSMGFTGLFVFSRIGAMAGGGAAAALAMGPPPVSAIIWLLLALIPISALFSAMALAAAAFARSSKEGQYYLIPLMMVSMPLMMLPMLPAAKLDIGSSLIPLTGLMLVLRALIEGQYAEALRFAGPVVMVTIVCCWLSIRWVVRQFNSENVLFRASEKFGVGAWVRQMLKERNALPTLGSAILCAVMILVLKFFVSFGMQAPGSWFQFTKQTIIVLVATVAVPAILMALVMTRSPKQSLRFSGCRLPVACAAILAALFLHPLFMGLTTIVMHVYPPAGDLVQMEQVIGAIMADAPGLWAIILVFALAPAIMEEIAFRGFILSGCQSLRNNWAAVLLTSVAFGMAHAVIQQSIITFVVGVILGWIAIRTRSIIPCILYHLTHNAITVCISMVSASAVANSSVLGWIMTSHDGEHFTYALIPAIIMSLLGTAMFVWLIRNGFHSKEDQLAREQESFAMLKRFLGRFIPVRNNS